MTGETQPYHRNDAVNFRLEVAIAAEIMWPLLVPQYTIVEKQNCSLVIATVILHELAVCLFLSFFFSLFFFSFFFFLFFSVLYLFE